jgi:hypothetical protein
MTKERVAVKGVGGCQRGEWLLSEAWLGGRRTADPSASLGMTKERVAVKGEGGAEGGLGEAEGELQIPRLCSG